MLANAKPTFRARALTRSLGFSVLLLVAGGCSDEDTPLDGGLNGTSGSSTGLPDSSMLSDGGNLPDASTGGDATTTSVDASTTGGDASSSSGPTTTQTAHGSCAGELIQRDYPVTVTVTGLSAADGTTVWGFASFGGGDLDFCSVLGETQVQGGAFTLSLGATSDGGYFPDVAFWIDDGNGTCDINSDIVFRSRSNRGARSLTLDLTSSDLDDDTWNDELDTACEPFDAFVQP